MLTALSDYLGLPPESGREVIQGYAATVPGLMTDRSDMPINLTGHDLTLECDFWRAQATHGQISAFNQQNRPKRAIPIKIAAAQDQPETTGSFSFDITADLGDGNIEPNERLVPVVIFYLKHTVNGQTRVSRFYYVYRRGIASDG